MSNGCGTCNGFWRYLKPITPHANFFKDDCNVHDDLYERGGDKYDRRIADYILLEYMLRRINKHFYKRKWLSRQWFRCICYSYYLSVRIFGVSSFNFK